MNVVIYEGTSWKGMSTLYIFQYMYVPSLKYHAYEQMKWKKYLMGKGSKYMSKQ